MDARTGKNATENRSTEALYLRVAPAIRQRAIEAAERYGLTISDYISALIDGHEPTPRLAVEVGALAILGQRCVAALNALLDDPDDAREAVSALRKAIVETILERRSEYDARLDRRGAEGRWG